MKNKYKRLSAEKLNDIWVQFVAASVAGLSAYCSNEDGGVSHKLICDLSEGVADEMTDRAQDTYAAMQDMIREGERDELAGEILDTAKKENERLVELLRLSDMALDTAEAHLPVAEGNKLAIQEIVSARKKLKEDIKIK